MFTTHDNLMAALIVGWVGGIAAGAATFLPAARTLTPTQRDWLAGRTSKGVR